MTERADLDIRELLASLSEKEKLRGHHSPEGRAIRTLSRALDGWSSGRLAETDAMALCCQAVEDWLKARLAISAWRQIRLPRVIDRAVAGGAITAAEGRRLKSMQDVKPPERRVLKLLCDVVRLIERRW